MPIRKTEHSVVPFDTPNATPAGPPHARRVGAHRAHAAHAAPRAAHAPVTRHGSPGGVPRALGMGRAVPPSGAPRARLTGPHTPHRRHRRPPPAARTRRVDVRAASPRCVRIRARRAAHGARAVHAEECDLDRATDGGPPDGGRHGVHANFRSHRVPGCICEVGKKKSEKRKNSSSGIRKSG